MNEVNWKQTAPHTMPTKTEHVWYAAKTGFSMMLGGLLSAALSLGVDKIRQQSRGARRSKLAIRMQELQILLMQISTFCDSNGAPLPGKEEYVSVLRRQALQWEDQIRRLADGLEDY